MPPTIQELQERWTYHKEHWKPIHDSGNEDMQYIMNQPWPKVELEKRRESGRLALCFDELNQYVNQIINDIRRNKRAVKVEPRGFGATDKVARLLQGRLRHIEYVSNAQAAYECGAEGSTQRGYGFYRFLTRYISDDTFDQELIVKRVGNPDSVTIDPDAQEFDGSDMRDAFVVDSMPHAQFKAKYKNAKEINFEDVEIQRGSGGWVTNQAVQVGEWWRVENTPSKLLYVTFTGGPQELLGKKQAIKQTDIELLKKKFGDALTFDVNQEREVENKKVLQYMSNGVEFLDEKPTPWLGPWIPIVPIFSKEQFHSERGGTTTKRKLISMIRNARDGQMLYNYFRTAQAETAGLAPKALRVGYEGQFATSTPWASINQEPVAYAEVKAKTTATGDELLPIPALQIYEPPIAALEVGAQAARRAIQAALGRYNSSVGQADSSARSGKAIDKLDAQSDQGSYHIIDNYERSLAHGGRIMVAWIMKGEDTARDVGMRVDDKASIVRINDPQWINPETQEQEHLQYGDGTYDVTITTGPSIQSEREEANGFVDTLLGNIKDLPLTPAQAQKILALAIKLKNLGPIGDQVVEVISPEEQPGQQLPPQAMAVLQGAQQKMQEMAAYAQKIEAELQGLQLEKKADIVGHTYRLKIEQVKADTAKFVATVKAEAEKVKAQLDAGARVTKDAHVAAHTSTAHIASMAAEPEPGADAAGAE